MAAWRLNSESDVHNSKSSPQTLSLFRHLLYFLTQSAVDNLLRVAAPMMSIPITEPSVGYAKRATSVLLVPATYDETDDNADKLLVPNNLLIADAEHW